MSSDAQRQRPAEQEGTQSQTQTQTQTEAPTQARAVLRLRGAHVPGRSVQWAENVVDNEGLGRKSSKGTPQDSLLSIAHPLTCRN